jgi:hypothetical protein
MGIPSLANITTQADLVLKTYGIGYIMAPIAHLFHPVFAHGFHSLPISLFLIALFVIAQRMMCNVNRVRPSNSTNLPKSNSGTSP